MFANSIVLKDSAAVDHTFALNKLEGMASERVDVASDRVYPQVLRVKRTPGTGSKPVDRYLVQVARTVATATSSEVEIANFTLALPRNSAVTTTHAKDLCSFVKEFLTPENIEALIRGSI